MLTSWVQGFWELMMTVKIIGEMLKGLVTFSKMIIPISMTKAIDILFFFFFLKWVFISENILENIFKVYKCLERRLSFTEEKGQVFLQAAFVLSVQWLHSQICAKSYKKTIQHLDLVTAVTFLYLIKSYYRNTPFKVIQVSHEDYLRGLFVSLMVMT